MRFAAVWLFTFTLVVAGAVLSGCGDDGERGAPAGVPSGPDTGATVPGPRGWTVAVSPGAPEGVQAAARDVVDYLVRMGLDADLRKTIDVPSCAARTGWVVFSGDGLGAPWMAGDGDNDQTWSIDETRCGGTRSSGFRVLLHGGGLLGRQYAAYEWLHALGVRFFHPEQEYVPEKPAWPAQPLRLTHTPAFRWRSVSLHLTHPLELGDAFRRCDVRFLPEAKRYIDWQIKNLASTGASGACGGDLAGYGLRRGFLPTSGLRLWGGQQGGSGVIDPDDPRSAEEQVTEAIEARMQRDPAPRYFVVDFQPTEFTQRDDREVVRVLTFIASYFAKHYPDVTLQAHDHGTYSDPTLHFGVRYNDLGRFAPVNMGLRIHPLMFYDLFRPAPVYGNENFNFFYDLMVEEYRRRSLWYFPEAAWWLTFDLPVPLYLPITIEARHRDIQGIAFMLDGGLEGHRVFGTGHEWGYWQNEYCPFRMTADLDFGYRDCLAEIAGTMGAAGPGVQSILEEVIRLQERDFIYGDILAYLVGTDPETEAAAAIGISFHPLPPKPREILNWTPEQVEDWAARIAPALQRMDQDYSSLVERLNVLEADVSQRGGPWFREVRDGVEVTGLRARHAYRVYGALVGLRRARLAGDVRGEAGALAMLEGARATTRSVLAVVHRRESEYRYRPLSRSIAGGPDGTEDDNWTIYHYRYLNRTHHAYYYERIDRLAEDAMRGSRGSGLVTVSSALLAGGEVLSVSVVPSLVGDEVDFGDGTRLSFDGARTLEHRYPVPGVYRLVVSGTAEAAPFRETLPVAVLQRKYVTATPARVLEPQGAALIASLIPALVFGPTGMGQVALGFDVNGGGQVDTATWVAADRADRGGVLGTAPVDLVVPIASGGAVLASIDVDGAVLDLSAVDAAPRLSGRLVTASVVSAIVDVGGFGPDDARGLVAGLLGYTPDTLPAAFAFTVEWDMGGVQGPAVRDQGNGGRPG